MIVWLPSNLATLIHRRIKAKDGCRQGQRSSQAVWEGGQPTGGISNSLAENTVASLQGQTKLRSPILGNGEDQDPENHELIFEEKFEGDMPDAVVGLMFSNQIVWAKDALNNA